MNIVEQLQKECEYDPDGDGSVDDLIAYKDALEDLVGSIPFDSMERIIAYNIEDEERDHAESVQVGDIEPLADSHIYTHLARVGEWLTGNRTSASATVDWQDDNMVLSFQGESYEHYRDAVDRLPFFGVAILLDGEIFDAILCGADRDADDGAAIKFIRVVEEEYDHTRYPADAVESAVVEKVWVS